MKHGKLIIAIAMLCVALVGCRKEPDYSGTYAAINHNHSVTQTNVYYLTVTYTGSGQQLAESGLINNLWYKCTREDAVLVYSKVGQNASGEIIYWRLQPFIESNGANYYYEQGDNGFFYFYADAGANYTWNSNFSVYTKIVVIPHTVYAEKSAQGVDHSNYEEVVKAYNIDETKAIKLN